MQFVCKSEALTKTITAIAGEASGGEGTVCGFAAATLVMCTIQAKNSVGFGEALSKSVYTSEMTEPPTKIGKSFFCTSSMKNRA